LGKRIMMRRAFVAAMVAATLGVAGIARASDTSTASQIEKCTIYTQLSGGGGSYQFADIQRTNISCNATITVLEVFANSLFAKVSLARPIAGFACVRHAKGRAFATRCTHGSKTIRFLYLVIGGGSGKLVTHSG
jgi:hypothetical protein